MTSVSLFDGSDEPSQAAAAVADAARRGALEIANRAAILVEFVGADGFAAVVDDWMSLAARAGTANAFMDPMLALAAARAFGRPLRILLARQSETLRLMGAWVFIEGRPRLTWPWRALTSPICSVAYAGSPVLDREQARPVLAAMLKAVRERSEMPKFIEAGDFAGDPPLLDDLEWALAENGMSAERIERRRRAKLESKLEPKVYWAGSMSDRRRQGFDRKRRQLSKLGRLEFSTVEEPEPLATVLEEFLLLEASGWKAERGSALLSDPAMASFTRSMVKGLAERRLVSIQSLRLDGAPLAMWVVLYSGSGAYTWRTAYDESYGRYSPGVLLLENTTAHLLSHPTVTSTDSCNHRDAGFQAERWAERHDVVDILIDVGRPWPLLLAGLALREKAIRRGRELARRLYHASRDWKADLVRRVVGPPLEDAPVPETPGQGTGTRE